MALIDLTGKIFSRLTVISRTDNRGNKTIWLCICECGNKTTVDGDRLRRGGTRSCGCLQRERASEILTKHGHTGISGNKELYSLWKTMIRRCYDKKSCQFHNYGGRGISVCEPWLNSFEQFMLDMGDRPHRYQIDRIDNNGNYEPENCRWVTCKENARNTRWNHNITAFGETLCLTEWSERSGLTSAGINKRLSAGWSAEDAVSVPATPRADRRKNVRAGTAN